MKREELITGFTQLGRLMVSIGNEEKWTGFTSGVTEEEYDQLILLVKKQFHLNGWFTNENVNNSLKALQLKFKMSMNNFNNKIYFNNEIKISTKNIISFLNNNKLFIIIMKKFNNGI